MEFEEEVKLNQKLAEWAGFKRLPQGRSGWHIENLGKVMTWMPPGHDMKEIFYSWDYLPNFTVSLDDCFEWLVPKVLDAKWKLNITATKFPHGKVHANLTCWDGKFVRKTREGLNGRGDSRPTINALAEQPALALCLAIEKLIDASEKPQDKQGGE